MGSKTDLVNRKEGGLTKVGESKLIEKLSGELKFNRRELRRIIQIYKKYLKDAWYMDVPVFCEAMHNSFGFTDDFFLKRLFSAADANKDRRVSIEEFIRVVAVMLRGTMEEKIHLCFSCYDMSDTNELTREDVSDLLLEAVSEPPTKDATTDGLRDLVDMIFTKLDEDEDGVITYDEFKKSCLRDWTLMEVFGQCLPDHRHRAAFLVLLEADEEITGSRSSSTHKECPNE